MNFETWKNCTLSDVSDNGPNSLYSLICDYEKSIKNYGWMSVNDFIQTWTAIQWNDFNNLKDGDIVYDYMGNKWKCTDSSFYNDDESCLYIECVKLIDEDVNKLSNNREIFSIGDLYFAPNYTRLAEYKHKILEREERACPILITKTKQHQN